ncbi:MAG: DUF1631 family protein [Chromatiales bacterium]|nr:DUF1631 family protein [Chromatiales bacterium]
MFIQIDQSSINSLLSHTNSKNIRGLESIIQLTFGGKKSKEIAITIAHLCVSGIGVAFKTADKEQEVIDYLAQHAKKQEQGSAPKTAATRKTPANSQEIIDNLHQRTEAYILKHFDNLIFRGSDELMIAAENASSNNDRTDLQFASSRLDSDKAGLKKLLLQTIHSNFDALLSGTPKDTKEDGELDLVDQDEFDEWLVIIGIARKFDGKYLALVNHFEYSLSKLLNQQIHNEDGPFSPYSLLWSFKEALIPLGFTQVAKNVLFEVFHQVVLVHLTDLYDELNKLFTGYGFSEQESRQGRLPTTWSTQQLNRESSQEVNQLTRVHQKEDIVGALAALSPHSTMSPLQALARNYQPESDKDLPRIVADQGAVIELLESITSSRDKSISEQLKELLAKQANTSTNEITFDNATTNSIETTESLVSSIQQDELLGEELKSFINDLEVPLVKESLINPTLLNDPDHPARKLLQVVGELAPFISSNESEKNQPLLDSLTQISSLMKKKGRAIELPVIEKRMETLLKLQKMQFDDNISIVLRSAQLEETRQRAQTFVLNFLVQTLTAEPIPQASKKVLEMGWPGLLTTIAATKSKQSQTWKQYSGVFELLQRAFPEDAEQSPLPETEVEELISTLKSGYLAYPVFRRQADDCIDHLQDLLKPDSQTFAEFTRERVTLTREELIDYLPDYEPESDISLTNISEELKPWVEEARRIAIGDWIIEHNDDDQPKFLSLGWKSTNSLRLVFVDGSGQKAADYTLITFAQKLQDKTYSILERGELPMVDRAVHRLLQQTYNQFKNESDKDELTGLLSRKAFQRVLSEALASSRAENNHHIFITINIDGFRVVNDVCGTEGGDELLNSIGKLLRTYSPSSAQLARMGDDEYGVLIQNCPLQRGYEIAERQRLAVESFKFKWDDTDLTITASIGIVPIDTNSASVNDLLNASAAACNLARHEGRNCTRIYQSTAEAYTSRQKLIRSVPAIEKALEKDRLKLFGQIISPVDSQQDASPHYEILLRVYDENNNLSTPVQFIQAAEQFDRMRYVDRWVINRFFTWMNKHHTQLPNNERFSLNLSALTLTDQDFSQFIKRKLDECTFPVERLAFEITETAFVSNMERAKSIVTGIRNRGCQFYLDDFGSGYASYSYLKEFPIDAIKIDGIFVKDMLAEKSSYAMVKSITEVAHFMDKKVIAEFVSSDEIFEALKAIGVDYAQGYALGKPLDIDGLISSDTLTVSA